MASWLAMGNDYKSDSFESEWCCVELNSIPAMKKSRKRTSASAGLDGFVADFERRLKLTPSCIERLKVADGLLRDAKFLMILMKSLPDESIRKLANVCSQWRTIAYMTLRERSGNNAFSLLWIDKDTKSFAKEDIGFDFNMFFHQAYIGLGGSTDAIMKSGIPLIDYAVGNDRADCLKEIYGGQITSRQFPRSVSSGKVEFILTYGSLNMEQEFIGSGEDETLIVKSAKPNCANFVILSSSVVATTPNGKQTVNAVSSLEPDKKLMTSILFPQNSHILFESFAVPSCPSQSGPPCGSKVIGELTGSSTKIPKALILYQYLNLIDSKPGIVEVLESLKMTQGSAGFPMVTGIYNHLEADLNTASQSEACIDPVASGLLICGDDFCGVSVITLNLVDIVDGLDSSFKQIEEFYDANNFSTKCALLFYHNEVTNQDSVGILRFNIFIDSFQKRLPNVKLHGIASLSGAHAMFVNPDANFTFNQLNARMTKLAGTVDSKTDIATMDLVLVLLTYEAD